GEEVHRPSAHPGVGLQPRPVRLSPRGGGDPLSAGPDSPLRGAAGVPKRGDRPGVVRDHRAAGRECRMSPQELKNSILQLAIQGKLMEQRPEEGTGEELFAQIQAEKQRLIEAGKIKKEKPLPEIAEDEKPFDIPEGWMWCR